MCTSCIGKYGSPDQACVAVIDDELEWFTSIELVFTANVDVLTDNVPHDNSPFENLLQPNNTVDHGLAFPIPVCSHARELAPVLLESLQNSPNVR